MRVVIDHVPDDFPFTAGDLVGARVHLYFVVVAGQEQLYDLHD